MDTPTPTPAQAAAALREISPLLMPNTTIGVQRAVLEALACLLDHIPTPRPPVTVQVDFRKDLPDAGTPTYDQEGGWEWEEGTRVLPPGFLPDDPARIRLPGCWEDTWCTPDGARVLASELLAAAETAELGIQEWLRNGPAAGQVEKGESQ